MTIVDHILNAVEKLLIDGLPTNQAPTTEVTDAQRFEWRAYIIAMLDAGMPTDAASNACRWLVRNRFKSPRDWHGEQGRTFRSVNAFRPTWPAPVVEIGGGGMSIPFDDLPSLEATAKQLANLEQWFRRAVELERRLMDGEPPDSEYETIGFHVSDKFNLDTFMLLLSVCQQVVAARVQQDLREGSR